MNVAQLKETARWLRQYAEHVAGRMSAPPPPPQPFELRQWADKIDEAADEITATHYEDR